MVFDLDHTLIKGNVSYAFGKYLYRKGALPLFPMLKCIYAYFCHKSLGKSLAWLHGKVLQTSFKAFRKASLVGYVEEFLDQFLANLYYKPAYEAFCLAQKQGALMAILSSSPDFLVESIAKRLNIPYWIGTCYRVDQEGQICEIAQVVDGEYKAEFLHQLMRRYQLNKEQVTAYSDSLLDLPMMNVAGVKVGVNPGRLFYSHCKKHHWNII